ncbi:MAG: 4Fe-4S binding protein [Planctomycetes bacterium]|nr:4Fe-4S binding protein [Planctomycetota bacterium]
MISHGGSVETVPNDLVYLMIGRAAPLDFFRKSGIPIVGEWSAAKVLTFLAFLLFCLWLYPAKSGKVPDEFAGGIGAWINAPPKALDQWLAPNVSAKQGHGAPTPDHRVAAVWRRSENRAVLVPSDSKEAMESTSPYYINTSFGGVLAESAKSIGFWYSLAYCVLVAVFGWKRYQKRRTPYVKLQTISLAAIQIVPLFLLPYAVLPYLGLHEMLPRTFLDWFFPEVNYGHGREYWRAFGFVLAWPLFFFNWLTSAPLLPWLILGAIQTFVLIPGLVYFFGKGAYCGWICSCGALAETLGDAHRQKMPHGPVWNRLNMAGQAILALAAALMVWRVAGWLAPKGSWIETTMPIFSIVEKANYWVVDAGLAGIVGVGFYFWYSGRVWCRFFCPLAALMHIYARFSQFRILADKKKCISCNACTSICHQGIDVMAFANKGKPMNDPECVRCSACVSTCPTGTLQFGRVGANGEVISSEILAGNLLRIAGRE